MSYADLRELHSALTDASDLAFTLDASPSGRATGQLVDALHRALAAASALSAEHGATGCPEHPRGAVDPLYGDREDPLPAGYGRCLLCNDRRRRADAHRRGPR